MANDLNNVELIGRATRDSELKYTSGGLAIGGFSIAVNKKFKGKDGYKDEVSYFEISMFGKLAETMQNYIKKGKQLCVKGELRQDRWEQDGQARSKVIIVADFVQLLGGHANQDSGSQGDRQPQQTYNPNDNLPSGDDDFPEDVPF